MRLVINAAFIAVISFGAIGGVLAAVMPQTFFGLGSTFICPRGSTTYDEWYDGESTQFRVNCVDAASGQSQDRTLLAVGFVLGMFFIIDFWIALIILLILRAARRKKYGLNE
jgi:hypothetical protein